MFSLTITTRPAAATNETAMHERKRIAEYLQRVAHELANGQPLAESNPIQSLPGGAYDAEEVGSYAFGEGSLNYGG